MTIYHCSTSAPRCPATTRPILPILPTVALATGTMGLLTITSNFLVLGSVLIKICCLGFGTCRGMKSNPISLCMRDCPSTGICWKDLFYYLAPDPKFSSISRTFPLRNSSTIVPHWRVDDCDKACCVFCT